MATIGKVTEGLDEIEAGTAPGVKVVTLVRGTIGSGDLACKRRTTRAEVVSRAPLLPDPPPAKSIEAPAPGSLGVLDGEGASGRSAGRRFDNQGIA